MKIRNTPYAIESQGRAFEGHQNNLGGKACDPLERDEELELAKRAKAGDRQAADKIVASHQRLVTLLANKYGGYGLPIMDLIQEGNMGLLRALEKFDPEKVNRFITYAAWWIKAYIMYYIVKNVSLTSGMTTRRLRKLFWGGNRAIAAFEEKHKRKPTPEELAQLLGVSFEDVECWQG